MSRRWALALVLLAGVGCLDGGEPPQGRQLIVGRGQDEVSFARAAAGQPSRILLTHKETIAAANTVDLRELSTVDDPGPGAAAVSARLLLENYAAIAPNCSGGPECRTRVDALGRLYVDQVDPDSVGGGTPPTDALVRIDPATGAKQVFGAWNDLALAADGTRVAISLSNGAGTNQIFVSDVAGPDVPLTAVNPYPGAEPTFVDDDFFFVTDDGHLAHLPRGATSPLPLVTTVLGYTEYQTARGAVLMLQVPEEGAVGVGLGGPLTMTSLLDVPTLTEVALPFLVAGGQIVAPSPSGRYVAAASVDGDTPADNAYTAVVTMFDRDAAPGASSVTSVGAPVYTAAVSWRPLHDDLWFATTSDLVRWPAGEPPQTVGPVPSPVFFSSNPPGGPQTGGFAGGGLPTFTPDGRFWLSVAASDDVRVPVTLRSGDEPAAPPQLLNPSGTVLAAVWPLPDGRMLVEDAITDVLRDDIYLVDPVARPSRALASGGHVIAAGRDRCLALLHWIDGGKSGDLTMIDYATGAQTVFAENVLSVAVETSAVDAPPVDASAVDALAAGTRVAFLVRNRIASPQDGLWVVDLP